MGTIFLIKIDDIPYDGFHLETQWDSNALTDILDAAAETYTVCSPLDLDLMFSLAGTQIIVDGGCKVQLRLNCVRCLSDFVWPLEVRFRYIFWPKSKESTAEEIELQKDDLEVIYFEGEHIDLRPLVSEQINLALPQYPHCTENCKGLCPQCGANLNETRCSCSSAAAQRENSPFTILQKLKKKQ